jgi:UDP-N-acetylglucosamine 2-epimerase (non-hydrolysing)
MKTILCIVGTRPEAIKMAPVILALQEEGRFEVKVLATAQHREILDQVLSIFHIVPDYDLNVMCANQTLAQLTSRLMTGLDQVLEAVKPDLVLAQGDTTTVLVSALASFYRQISFGHVEAGLRTGNRYFPFPEEMNRALAGRLARFHFAPTESAKANLLREGFAAEDIKVTGNTVIDALLAVANQKIPLGVELDPGQRLILLTAHRRENFGAPLMRICRAIRSIVDRNPDVTVLYPVHPNPNVHDVAHQELGGHPRIRLVPPLDYGPFVTAMKRSYLILTDSGGIQEEAPALGKPVLVLRSETERPEAVNAGVVRLVGTDEHRIVEETQRLLDDMKVYRSMARGESPYGDGHAAARIVDILRRAQAQRRQA